MSAPLLGLEEKEAFWFWHYLCVTKSVERKKISLMVNVLPVSVKVLIFFFFQEKTKPNWGLGRTQSKALVLPGEAASCRWKVLDCYLIQRFSKPSPELAIVISLRGPGPINPESERVLLFLVCGCCMVCFASGKNAAWKNFFLSWSSTKEKKKLALWRISSRLPHTWETRRK